MLIGILGGGQLGRMLALAGIPLGLRFRFYDPSPDACARDVGELVVGEWDDHAALLRFVTGLGAATYEFENVPLSAAEFVAQRTRLDPPAGALATGQDRLLEKSLFQRVGIPVPPFETTDSPERLRAAAQRLGTPFVIKTRRGGYDGKGQMAVRDDAELDRAASELGSLPLLVEKFVPFDFEVSILAARSINGAEAFYPLVRNVHRAGILRRSDSPAPGITDELQRQAETHAAAVLSELRYTGVLAIEFFVKDGGLLGNELAPRVHNSGHWTIEGAAASQFENHLRAILGWPLGSVTCRGRAVMLNAVSSLPARAAVLGVPGAHLHDYGKAGREGRKVGHITLTGDDAAEVVARAEMIEKLLRGG